VDRLVTYCKNVDLGIDLQKSYFYTDSIVDLPVLERVGNPVAVHPDSELATLAVERGWKIIGDQKTIP
jgi:phosphoserine phosphatase